MANVQGLRCRECGQEYAAAPLHVCELCFGPLEVVYAPPAARGPALRAAIQDGPPGMWRYRNLLPLEKETVVGRGCGGTPLVRAERLGRELGIRNLYLKNDGISQPTLSVKDRAVAVALAQAAHFGFQVVACASTGHLAQAVAAQAAEGGFRSYLFLPADMESGRATGALVFGAHLLAVSGDMEEINRLCVKAAERYGWAFVNINLRPYYEEGLRTFGFEIAEQLGWRAPDHIVTPCAGGSLLAQTWRGLNTLAALEVIDGVPTRMHAAQAAGCNPITAMLRSSAEVLRPVRPQTIARSLAVSNPADGYAAVAAVRESGGWAEEATDAEIREGIRLLARTEGIFTGAAGGVTVAAARKLSAQGRFGAEEAVVLALTGNGLKAPEFAAGEMGRPTYIQPTLASLDTALRAENLIGMAG